jgi:Na+/melibiose symporter-like transporter
MNENTPPFDSANLPRSSSKPANGSRFAIALTCWLLSSIGVLMSLMVMVGVSIVALLTKPLAETLQSSSFYLGFGAAYAWAALAVMTGGWVSNEPVAWHWPVVGGVLGLICSAFFFAFIPLYLPCLLLGLYLSYFHLAGYSPDAENSS